MTTPPNPGPPPVTGVAPIGADEEEVGLEAVVARQHDVERGEEDLAQALALHDLPDRHVEVPQ